MYHPPPDDMLLCTHVDDFLLAASSLCLSRRFHTHYSLHHDCEFFSAGTFVGIDIIRDRDALKCIRLRLLSLIVCLSKNSGVSCVVNSEHLTSNDLQYNPGKDLHKYFIGRG